MSVLTPQVVMRTGPEPQGESDVSSLTELLHTVKDQKAIGGRGSPEWRVAIYERSISVYPSPVMRAGKRRRYEKSLPHQSSPLDPSGEKKRNPPKRKRGDIKFFSRKSRSRLMNKFHRIHTEALSESIFLSLTHRKGSISQEQFQQVFRKRFLPGLKEIVPDLVFMWRLEPHRNGYPHYHMVLWSYKRSLPLSSEYYLRKIRALWRECIGENTRATQLYSCKIVKVESVSKLTRYISKYLGKEDSVESSRIRGRRWAFSRNAPIAAIMEVDVPYYDVEAFLTIARKLLRRRKYSEEQIDRRLYNPYGMSLWLSTDEMSELIARAGPTAMQKQYSDHLNQAFLSGDIDLAERFPDYFQAV